MNRTTTTTTSALYKVLGEDRAACHGGTGVWPVNRWRARIENPIPCQRGYHLCRREDLVLWLGPAIWVAEADGPIIEAGNKVVVGRARITRRLDTWNDRTARLFAADCAERVLPIFERARPTDDRPRRAIEAARAYARGEIDDAAGAARAAAWAAEDAARAAARAAWDAADDGAAGAWQTDRLFDYLEGRAR